MATQSTTTPRGVTEPVRLSSLFRDPALRAAFERGERDPGACPVEAPRPNKPLSGGSFVLPKSGLRLVARADGSMLFKGGRS